VVKAGERKMQILEILDGDSLTSQEVNDRADINHAARLLRYYWSQGLLTRDEENLSQGGIRYRYTLSDSGKERLDYLK